MNDPLHHLDLFEEASGRWEECADGLFKLLSGLEDDVGGGGGHSDDLDVVGGGIPDFCNQCLGQHCIEMVL